MDKFCTRRQKLLEKFAPLLRPVFIWRRELSSLDESTGPQRFVCSGKGYRYYKFERVSGSTGIPGNLSRERTERVLFFHDAAHPGCGGPAEAFACDPPGIRSGDICVIDEKRFCISNVQDDTGVYLTLVVTEGAV